LLGSSFQKLFVRFVSLNGENVTQKIKNLQYQSSFMTATLTYTLVLAAIYFGRKAIDVIDQE